MLPRPHVPSPRPWVVFAAAALLAASPAPGGEGGDPAAGLDRALAAAESSLREGEQAAAESHYRSALLEGWLLLGALDVADGRLPEAREALRRAGTSAVETKRADEALALVHLQLGEAAEAVALLTRVAGRSPKDVTARQLLAQALAAGGHPDEAVQELEEAQRIAPDDLELAFGLATGYLRVRKVDAAERLFARIARERPIPQTHVLIGRIWSDFGVPDRARAELRAALRQDPRVRRAHYYLGMIALVVEGQAAVDDAIAEFRRELAIAPGDPLTNLRLGMALVEARRFGEALPALQIATKAEPPQADAFLYLGRCQLGLEHPADAADALRRALDLAQGPKADEPQLRAIHYQLAMALRAVGDRDAAAHFAEAERFSAQGTATSRERLSRYLAGGAGPDVQAGPAPPIEAAGLAPLSPAQRRDLRTKVVTALARVYLNLGVMMARSERPARAAELLEAGAAVDADFPELQRSLGVAYFNAGQFDKATAPLARAAAAAPGDPSLKRMLAMAWLNAEHYEQAVELLRDDPERAANPSLEYAYGLALVRSHRSREAAAVFDRLLAAHGDSPELLVVMGQAHADQGDFEAAIRTLEQALARKPDVAEANATLGIIYLKQGRLQDAEGAFRRELRTRPGDAHSQHDLATVLDLEGRSAEALPLLRAVLKAKPDFADARYLLGKILLAEGAAAEAVDHLEAAARTAPDEANIHYQLAQAYQKLGRVEQAQEQFAQFQKLKDERRGATP